MGTRDSLLPLLVVALPVVTALVIVSTRRLPALRDTSLVVGAAGTFAAVAAMVPSVLAGEVLTSTLGSCSPASRSRSPPTGWG
jgi:hypothetical protein